MTKMQAIEIREALKYRYWKDGPNFFLEAAGPIKLGADGALQIPVKLGGI